jgi:hypothetical protein
MRDVTSSLWKLRYVALNDHTTAWNVFFPLVAREEIVAGIQNVCPSSTTGA